MPSYKNSSNEIADKQEFKKKSDLQRTIAHAKPWQTNKYHENPAFRDQSETLNLTNNQKSKKESDPQEIIAQTKS